MAKIYISSTYEDLKEYREEAYRTLRKLGHDVIAMEDYTADDLRPLDKCLADVNSCDVYIGIFAWCYGSIEPRKDKSFTELEYREAKAKRKKCLLFLLADDALWKQSLVDENIERIKAFRKELKQEFMADSFGNKDELASAITIAISKALAPKDNTVAVNAGEVWKSENNDGAKVVLEAQKPFFTTVKITVVVTLLAMIACSFSSSVYNGIGLPMAFTFICVFSFLTIGGSAFFSIKMAEIYKKA
jgi:hypothetical protein